MPDSPANILGRLFLLSCIVGGYGTTIWTGIEQRNRRAEGRKMSRINGIDGRNYE
jgi:hypothetical protein